MLGSKGTFHGHNLTLSAGVWIAARLAVFLPATTHTLSRTSLLQEFERKLPKAHRDWDIPIWPSSFTNQTSVLLCHVLRSMSWPSALTHFCIVTLSTVGDGETLKYSHPEPWQNCSPCSLWDQSCTNLLKSFSRNNEQFSGFRNSS